MIGPRVRARADRADELDLQRAGRCCEPTLCGGAVARLALLDGLGRGRLPPAAPSHAATGTLNGGIGTPPRSRTGRKVNRCLYEGRRAFLSRYAGIESGEECKRWAPLLSALVDGEATTEQLVELRPHLRQCGCCRAVVRELHRSNAPLAAVFPVAIVAVAADHADAAGNVFLRTYESLTSWATERSASSLVRAQIVTESVVAAAGKGTAVVAATAAAASGGAVVLDQGSGLPSTGQRAVLIAQQPTSHASRTDGAALIAAAARSSRQRATVRSAAAAVSASQSAAVAPAAHSPAPSSPPAVSAPQPAASAPTAEMGLE